MELSLDKFQATDEIKKNVWVVTEKIHGANFSCHTDGTECIFARRRDFLKANEGFYNFRKADFMKDLPEKVNKIFKKVQELITNHEISQVIVFGELFGGMVYFNIVITVFSRKMFFINKKILVFSELCKFLIVFFRFL